MTECHKNKFIRINIYEAPYFEPISGSDINAVLMVILHELFLYLIYITISDKGLFRKGNNHMCPYHKKLKS